MTAAYRCQVVDGWLRVNYQAALRSQCADSLDLAIQRLQLADRDGGWMRHGAATHRLAQNGVGQAA